MGVLLNILYETLQKIHIYSQLSSPLKAMRKFCPFLIKTVNILRYHLQKDLRGERPRGNTSDLLLVLVILSDCLVDIWHRTKGRVDK